jgi:hypothetical protein
MQGICCGSAGLAEVTPRKKPHWAVAWSCDVCNNQFFGGKRCFLHNVTPERRDEAIRKGHCYSCEEALRDRWERYTGSCNQCVPVKLLKQLPTGRTTPFG